MSFKYVMCDTNIEIVFYIARDMFMIGIDLTLILDRNYPAYF